MLLGGMLAVVERGLMLRGWEERFILANKDAVLPLGILPVLPDEFEFSLTWLWSSASYFLSLSTSFMVGFSFR